MGKPRLPDVEKQEMLDLPMLLLTMLLTVLGLVMIYSSSFARALYESGDSAYYFKRQAIFALVGTGAMLAISRVRPELIRKMAFPVLGASILFLILVFVPGIGRSENGATRWVSLGISFQPSEVAKLGVILSFAAMIARFGEKMETFRWGIAPFAGILAVIVVLLRLEPHNSAIVIIACTAGAMLFLGGVKYRWFILGGCAMLLGLILILGAGGYDQNFPEGAIISMPLHAEGMKKSRAFLDGVLSGAVEPIGAVLTVLAAQLIVPALPYLLSFAAGAMLYVVVEELIPEMSQGTHSNIGTVFFAVGFTAMMILDVALG